MSEIKFEEYDIVGESTLSVISEAHNFNEWMYETIKPFCNGKVLEIGSGIGNISEYFFRDNVPIYLSDIRAAYCTNLERKFGDKPTFLGVEDINIADPEFDEKSKDLIGSFNTVFALNVVEHIENDALAIQNCSKLLKPGGNLIILVPSYNNLYNQFDKELGHYRRYTKFSLSKLFSENHFNIVHKQYFNFIGILGWYVSGRVLKKKSIPGGQMALYNKLVPIFKVIDILIGNAAGLSTIIVAKKKNL